MLNHALHNGNNDEMEEAMPAVYDAFQTVLYPKHDADPAACYKGKFYAYALFGLLDEWILRGFHESPEEMIRISEYIPLR